MGKKELTILARGHGWVVVAKPPRLVVHHNEHSRGAYPALQRVRDQLGCSVYPIHRLDAAASGCLLFGTDRDAAGVLAGALGRGEKTYVALVRGVCGEPSSVDVQRPLRDDNGIIKEARTLLSCAARSREPPCSLVVARPVTGRYHQIRRHLRGLSHPIIGDRQHGDKQVNRLWREHRGVDRLALHCLSITFQAPDGGRVEATCPLFDDMATSLRQLPFFDEVARKLPALGAAALPRNARAEAL